MSLIPIFPGVRIVPRDEDYLDRKSGSRGEIFFDKDNQSLRIFDGANVGGTHILTPTNVAKQITSSGVATVTFSTTVARNAGDTANVYYYNGVENPELTLVVGYTYVFDQTDLTNLYFPNSNGTTLNQHPLNFSSDDANGELGSGTTYLNNVLYIIDGVTVNKTTYYEKFATATTRSVQITVTSNTPATLYIWCKNHSGMGNSITVAEPGAGGGGASLAVSDTAPSSPTQGDIWYNSTSAKLYVYVQDTDSSQWVQPAAPAAGTLLGLGIADGTNGQILTTNGSGTFTFEDAPQGFDGAFSSLSGTPTTLSGYGITDAQATLVSATNIKTVNGTSLLGSGDITISGSGSTGNITFDTNTIDSSDSAAIVFTPAVNMDSDVEVGNDLTVGQDATVSVNLTVNNDAVINNNLTVQKNLIINGEFTSEGSGTPEIFSDNEIELNAGTRIVPTTGPFQMLRVTTTQRNALTAANGDVVYNTTDNKFQGYEAGSWVNLV